MIKTIGGYEIKEELGRGGMGVVYRGFDAKLERDVAIKVVENLGEESDSLTQTTHQELVERFTTEAKAIAKLNHPNIVNIYDFGTDNELYYMVMEYMKGRDLSQLLKFNSPLAIDLVLKCIIPVCDALDYAHQTGIIHRDIKPANIILLDNGVTKLMDFGIARIQEAQSQLTQAGTILGSVLYISPEQLISAQKVDKRADIYSLGITMYELLTGRFPYDGDSVPAIIGQIMNSEPEPPVTYNDKISPELNEVILHTIQKNPEHRFQRATEVGEALSEILYAMKGGAAMPLKTASSSTFSSGSSLSKTSFNRAAEFSLVAGVDNLSLYALIHRIIQTWSVENIGNKPLLEAIFKNENLSQAIIVSEKVILLVYRGLVIGAVSTDPDEVGSAAYEATAEIVKVDIKACIPAESQQEYLIVLASILGGGRLLAKQQNCNSKDLENFMTKIKDDEVTGHMEIITPSETKYKGFVDGNEMVNLILPNENRNDSGSGMAIEVYEANLKLFGPSLRRALIETSMQLVNKKHGSAATFKQLALQKANKLFPEMVEEAIRNTDIAILANNDKVINIGKKSLKYSEIIQNFSAAALVNWLVKGLLHQIAASKNFNALKLSFNWIWQLSSMRLSQSVKLNNAKTLTFDLIAYDSMDKLSLVSRYSSQSSVTELQNFISDAVELSRNSENTALKAAVYISGEDFFPEVLRYYEKIVKKQSMFAINGPKCYIKHGNFCLLLVKENADGYQLIRPVI